MESRIPKHTEVLRQILDAKKNPTREQISEMIGGVFSRLSSTIYDLSDYGDFGHFVGVVLPSKKYMQMFLEEGLKKREEYPEQYEAFAEGLLKANRGLLGEVEKELIKSNPDKYVFETEARLN
jgi:hypothetical protein